MTNIAETIELFLKKYKLSDENSPFLVGFSGGSDSLCLLDCLHKLNYNLVALHLNHNWRGEESKKDSDFCKNFCEERNLSFYSEILPDDVSRTETAAREARYQFFERCAEKFNSKVIFTAHNANDNAETLLYRIIKGTGTEGLSGIAENREIFYRPLLEVCRSDIEDYCKTNGLSPIFDSSNLDVKYKRNFIRHKILPLMEEINKDAVSALNSLAKVAREESEIINFYLDECVRDCENSVQDFVKLMPAVQNRIIYKLFKSSGLDYDRTKILNAVKFINDNSACKSGKIFSVTTDLYLFASQKVFYLINPSAKNECELKITSEGCFDFGDYVFMIKKTDRIPEKFPKDEKCIAYVSLDKINFTLRTRRDGDIIYPLGAGGSQKLKKYFNAKKIPNHKKDLIPLLCCDNEVLWAAGCGISDKIKIGKNPVFMLKLMYKN